jgi:hypothetical protein
VLTIADESSVFQNDDSILSIVKNNPTKKIEVEKELNLASAFLNRFDLVILGLESWNKIREINSEWITNGPSILIINK